MKQFFRTLLVKVLALVKRHPVLLTDREALAGLLKSLHPVSIDKPLVRLGPAGDGGYLVPDDLVGVEACYSPGVSTVSGFEKDCAGHGIKTFMADKSVEGAAVEHPLFHFTKKYVGAFSTDDFMTMDQWVNATLPDSTGDLIFQIDIEGFEYETFFNLSDTLMNRFRIIVAEFHWMDQLWNTCFFGQTSRVFEKILRTHHCVHIHPNNFYSARNLKGISIPPLMEFTFYRKDRANPLGYANQFPHALDHDCTDNPHVALPASWYNQG